VTLPRSTPNALGLDGGRYRVERRIGQGGMGVVYAVFDRATHRRVALKRLREQAGPIAAAMFEREYQTLAQLRHPNIVEVYEYVADEQGAFYTMELLEGRDLANQAPMAWRDVCVCLRDAASVLGVLHARRLVHRDLSPGNLWRTPGGRIKLIDFGALAPFGVAREVVGTPPFVDPRPWNVRRSTRALTCLPWGRSAIGC
jgi:serine/threonine protein kinase